LFFNRIQQIQLLSRDLREPNHENLWNQLEAEIYLHRHKTVIRACRGREKVNQILPMPPGHVKTFSFSFFALIYVYFK
jgi:hypothetical protein